MFPRCEMTVFDYSVRGQNAAHDDPKQKEERESTDDAGSKSLDDILPC